LQLFFSWRRAEAAHEESEQKQKRIALFLPPKTMGDRSNVFVKTLQNCNDVERLSLRACVRHKVAEYSSSNVVERRSYLRSDSEFTKVVNYRA